MALAAGLSLPGACAAAPSPAPAAPQPGKETTPLPAVHPIGTTGWRISAPIGFFRADRDWGHDARQRAWDLSDGWKLDVPPDTTDVVVSRVRGRPGRLGAVRAESAPRPRPGRKEWVRIRIHHFYNAQLCEPGCGTGGALSEGSTYGRPTYDCSRTPSHGGCEDKVTLMLTKTSCIQVSMKSSSPHARKAGTKAFLEMRRTLSPGGGPRGPRAPGAGEPPQTIPLLR